MRLVAPSESSGYTAASSWGQAGVQGGTILTGVGSPCTGCMPRNQSTNLLSEALCNHAKPRAAACAAPPQITKPPASGVTLGLTLDLAGAGLCAKSSVYELFNFTVQRIRSSVLQTARELQVGMPAKAQAAG